MSDLKLLEDFSLSGMPLNNRMVMGPMTRNRAGDRVPNDLMKEYYKQRSSAGLIITEATQVSEEGIGYPATPGIHTEEQKKAWKPIVDTIHEEGSKVFLQLWHVGRVSHSDFHGGELPVAPSAIPAEGQAFTPDGFKDFETPRALAAEEVKEVVKDLKAGAENAKEAGFDGVELHAANGYLINQFLENGSNKREDQYGGSLENRSRLLFEALDALTEVWDVQRIGIRLSPNGFFNGMHDSDPVELYTYVLHRLNEYDLAYVHFVEEARPDGKKYAHYPDNVLDTYSGIFNGTTIVCGGMTRESGEQILQDGKADLIAFATVYIANPDLPERFAENAELNEPDPDTFYGGGEEGYVDYPALN